MNHPFIRSEKRQAIKACRFSNLHTNHTFPPPPLHTALVSFLHPKQKGTTDMELSIQTISMTYPSGKQALKDLNLDLKSPSLIGLLGPNGAGKSTLMKLLVAALMPTEGSILVDGAPLNKVEGKLKASLGYLPQDFGLFEELTVTQFLDYMAALKGLRSPQAAIRDVIRAVNLEEKARARIRTLSGGQRQRVGIARALAAGPEILLMDEPFGAVDEITRGQLQEEILRIHRESGITILFVTHDIAEALKLGIRTLVMDGGTVQQCDRPEELLRHPATDFVRELVEPQRRRDSILQRRRLPL